jgi:hypothetical protein
MTPQHPARAVVGFRVRSGWSVAILLAGGRREPVVVERCVVQRSDPDVPESAQPFHAALGVHEAAAAQDVRRLTSVVERFAARSLDGLIVRYAAAGYRVSAAAIVAGSTVDPSSIRNEHIRAHTEEGRLFRRVIENAMRNRGLETRVIGEKALPALVAAALDLPRREPGERAARMGRAVGSPWRAEEKTATLAAWTMLR